MVKTDQIYIVCGRSFKEFFFKWLCNAANEKSITKFF
jgi:sarcosine oxidase gamma subunit